MTSTPIPEQSTNVEDLLIKRENDLKAAKAAISKLQSDIGTLTVASCSSNDELSDTSCSQIKCEILQHDSTLARDFKFKTNVRDIIFLVKIYHWF